MKDMLMNIFQHWYSKCAFTVKWHFKGSKAEVHQYSFCGWQCCIIVCPVTHTWSASVSECGLSVSTRRGNLSRWSRPDLTSTDKLYLTKSSCVFAGIFSLLHTSVALHTEDNINRLNTELRSLSRRKYLSDTHTGVLWSYQFIKIDRGYHMGCNYRNKIGMIQIIPQMYKPSLCPLY